MLFKGAKGNQGVLGYSGPPGAAGQPGLDGTLGPAGDHGPPVRAYILSAVYRIYGTEKKSYTVFGFCIYCIR